MWDVLSISDSLELSDAAPLLEPEKSGTKIKKPPITAALVKTPLLHLRVYLIS